MSVEPARWPHGVTLGYLALTLPFFARGGWTDARIGFLVAHVAAMLWLWVAIRQKRTTVIGDLLPLALVPLMYAELPQLMTGSAYGDPLVQSWEQMVFGTQPARALAATMPYAVVSEVLHGGYLSFYAIVYVPPLVAYVRGRAAAFDAALLAVMSTYAVCYLTFVLFPVEGPRYVWGPPADVPDGPVRSLTLALLERGSSRGTAFPSSHAAVSVAQTIVALRHQREVGTVVAIGTALLMVGAVYGGFHYAVDVIAGAILGTAIAAPVALRLRPSDHPVRFPPAAR